MKREKKAARTLKENVIIEASLKQLDTTHLTELLIELLRQQLQSLSAKQFEKNYRRALTIKQLDPHLFRGNPEDLTASLELMWTDRKNGLCSEQKKHIIFVDPSEEVTHGWMPVSAAFTKDREVLTN